jgi:hypothetical protein
MNSILMTLNMKSETNVKLELLFNISLNAATIKI